MSDHPCPHKRFSLYCSHDVVIVIRVFLRFALFSIKSAYMLEYDSTSSAFYLHPKPS